MAYSSDSPIGPRISLLGKNRRVSPGLIICLYYNEMGMRFLVLKFTGITLVASVIGCEFVSA